MKQIGWDIARTRLCNIGASQEFITSVHFFYCDRDMVNGCIIDYIKKLSFGGLSFEQIMKILTNATGTTGIFDIRCFFAELGPKAKMFGFTPKRIESDIQEFIIDMEKYKHELITMRAVRDKFNNPSVAPDNLYKITDLCSNGKGKYYRAGIDAAVWHMLAFKTADEAAALIKPFITKDGFDILGLLQKTTKQTFDFASAPDYEYPLSFFARISGGPSK